MDARLNVTYAGQNGDLPDSVDFDTSDAALITMATEALQTGGIPGIDADASASLSGYQVERFPAKDDNPIHKVVLRPKTSFGS